MKSSEVVNQLRGPALLAALGVLCFAAFGFQRGRSAFLAAEARVEESKLLAARTGVLLSEVLALHELLGGNLPAGVLDRRVRAFAAHKEELGDELLAVLAMRGRARLAEQLRRVAGGDRDELHRLIRAQRLAVDDAVRFASVADRYAARGHD